MSEILEIISSFYLPVSNGKLLLPNVSVAEVVDFQDPEGELDSDCPAYLGKVKWRGLMLPLVAYELANGENFELSDSARIAVINSVGEQSKKMPFFALVTQGIPRLVKINEESIESSEDEPGKADAACVKVDGELATIPNLKVLETMLLNYL